MGLPDPNKTSSSERPPATRSGGGFTVASGHAQAAADDGEKPFQGVGERLTRLEKVRMV
jgi:hypothetical protein